MSLPDEPKQWSYAWFAARSAEARAEMATWPKWMRESAHWRTTPSLPEFAPVKDEGPTG